MATKWISLDKLRYTVSKIYTLLQGKVDKTDGKGLSTNDLTNELKNQYTLHISILRRRMLRRTRSAM